MHSSICPALTRAGTLESCFREKHNNLIRRPEFNKLKLKTALPAFINLKEGHKTGGGNQERKLILFHKCIYITVILEMRMKMTF